MLVGIVSKVIDNKTISVIVSRKVPHPLYKKVVKINKKYLVDKENEAALHVGDSVRISQTRPVSKRKKWKIVNL
jgi:small subunit ribosomal protein S17